MILVFDLAEHPRERNKRRRGEEVGESLTDRPEDTLEGEVEEERVLMVVGSLVCSLPMREPVDHARRKGRCQIKA
jgi:hypothetical protein